MNWEKRDGLPVRYGYSAYHSSGREGVLYAYGEESDDCHFADFHLRYESTKFPNVINAYESLSREGWTFGPKWVADEAIHEYWSLSVEPFCYAEVSAVTHEWILRLTGLNSEDLSFKGKEESEQEAKSLVVNRIRSHLTSLSSKIDFALCQLTGD